MSRLIRVTVVAALAAAAFVPAAATAAPPVPCDVSVEPRWVGGENWTALVLWPTVDCS